MTAALVVFAVVLAAGWTALAADDHRDTRTRPAHRAPRAPRITAWAHAHRPTWSAR